ATQSSLRWGKAYRGRLRPSVPIVIARQPSLRRAIEGTAAQNAETGGNLPDTPCSAPCSSFRRRIKQRAELFADCRPEKPENKAQIADLPVFLPVTREQPTRRPVFRDCVHHQEVGCIPRQLFKPSAGTGVLGGCGAGPSGRLRPSRRRSWKA